MLTRKIASALALATLLLTGCGQSGPVQPASLAPAALERQPHLSALFSPDAAMRITRLPAETFTKSSLKPDAEQADAVNMVLVGSEQHVREAILRAGWMPADPITFLSSLGIARAVAFHMSYPTAPISNLYLFGRKQDMGFQRNSHFAIMRDHFRIWKSDTKDAAGRDVWVVAACKDDRVRLMGGPTHIIDPKIDDERDYLAQTLTDTGSVIDDYKLPGIGAPYKGTNGEGDPYETDGMVRVLSVEPALQMAQAM